jgi:hypothetical protein
MGRRLEGMGAGTGDHRVRIDEPEPRLGFRAVLEGGVVSRGTGRESRRSERAEPRRGAAAPESDRRPVRAEPGGGSGQRRGRHRGRAGEREVRARAAVGRTEPGEGGFDPSLPS